MTAAERFWAKIDLSGDCWLWRASLDRDGYGRFALAHSTIVRAHRYAYELLVGPIPEGLTIDHLCRVRHCVNPAHLEPVTGRENTLRGDTTAALNAAKETCPQGHPFDAANTYLPARGGRECRACRREAVRRHQARATGRAG